MINWDGIFQMINKVLMDVLVAQLVNYVGKK